MLPDDLNTGAILAAAANRSGEPKRERSSTSARNSAVMTIPIPGKLMTTFPCGLVSTSSARRVSRAAIRSLVLNTSEAISATSAALASAAGSSWRLSLGGRDYPAGEFLRAVEDAAGFEPTGQAGLAEPTGSCRPCNPAHGEEGTLLGQIQRCLQAREDAHQQFPEAAHASALVLHQSPPVGDQRSQFGDVLVPNADLRERPPAESQLVSDDEGVLGIALVFAASSEAARALFTAVPGM
jgi:hypothetical protein